MPDNPAENSIGSLSTTDVHLWLTDLEQVSDSLIPAYLDLMNPQELERNQRYRFAADRFADCVTRALARTVLSHYTGVAPASWSFAKGAHGKPEIDTPQPELPLRFNLSHTHRYVVCAVALECDLGVDIECVTRSNNVLAIADHYFSAREIQDLFALPKTGQENRFYDYWTLKEAYLKARGEGISLGLKNFSFDLVSGADIAIHFTPAIADDPARWLFRLLSPCPDHRLAVALKAGSAPPSGLRLFETVPLTSTVRERSIY